ncbi:terminase family protein [Pasteurella multocida subsp. multocida]|uniref:Terminase family protein n=1 Tax=Pasteurella multocida TaxID=747 RepID=A0A9X3ZMG1_PASMD|nr:terminase family protein [Pasteurella multocida]MBF6981654.1 terminase [Pasteurella multocida]MDA5611807.1 terminase family protein [Pasteurella multocida]MDA5614274.1 terminase family protein [Pasteurella multocida]MDA5619346.1 terminase family protein [Pasteurella multocida subsp. multocida]MDA5621873.1 terminase family protein [Pasteurella multocida subsp. multocida]
MQEQEENIEIIVKPEIDLKRKAQVMYFGGYKIAEISRQLDIPVSTISSWKERDKWDDIAPVGRVELALESRMILLIAKEQKSGADFKEIDLLGRQMEKVARVKKYSFGEGNETDLNPKIKNRNSGPRKTGDKNPISEEQQELLINGFLEGMFNYQRTWFDAGKQHRIRNILKSRQIGATYYFAHEALVDALVTGRNQIFLSASKKQALQFRSYITAYARKTADVELKGETILLPNGAELIFLGTNSATAQSYHGNLYFDEIFWVPKFAEMRKVAAAMASQKQYRQTYFSTPTTIASDAYQFWSGKSFNKRRPKEERIEIDISHENLRIGKLCADRQWKQIVNIYDAEAGGCNLFDIEDLIAENSREEFEQLYMCQFADDTSSVFKFNELQLCQVDSLEDWKDYKPFFKRPFGNREVWIGYDPSHTGDRAALVIVAPPRVDGGDYRILHYQTFHGLDFEPQAKQIQRYTEEYNVTKMMIDKTGLGAGVYQEVKKFYPAAIGLDYNVDLKNEMVIKTLNLIQKRRLKFDGKEVISSFMTVKKRLTRSGRQMTYVSDRSKDASHGDICWAVMNCVLNIPFGENLNHHKNGSTIFTFN